MMDYYLQFKAAHVAAVFASGGLFFVRGLLRQIGRGWGKFVMDAPVRYLSYVIDTVLLATALMLVTILPAGSFGNGWLAAKLILLVGYVGLGTFALKRGRTRRTRLTCYGSALAVYAAMFIVARTHDPLGPLRMLFG